MRPFLGKSQQIACWVLHYCLTVVVFALVYWGIFSRNTTSFLISEQLNKHLERYDLLSTEFGLMEYHRDTKDLMPLTIEGLSTMLNPELDHLGLLNDSLSYHQQQLASCESRLDSISNVIDCGRRDAIEAYKKKSLEQYVISIDSLERLMEGVDSSELIASGIVAERANLKLKKAIKERIVLDYIIEHYQFFIPYNQSNFFLNCSNEKIRLLSIIQRLECDRREQVTKIRGIVNRFHLNRSSSVGFLEFLYYSICVSTTVSFGDIAPNNGLTRFLAILELLLCIVIVGFILDGIIRRRENPLNYTHDDEIETMDNEEKKRCFLKRLWNNVMLFFKTKALAILFIIALIPIIVYVCHFHGLKLSDNPADWGVFGDYIGGVYSVLIAILVVYISRHLDIRDEEAKQKKEALRKIHLQMSSIQQAQVVNLKKLTKLYRLIDESKLYIDDDLYYDLKQLANYWGEKGRNRAMEKEIMDALKNEYAEK